MFRFTDINESEHVLQGLVYHCPNEDNWIRRDLLCVPFPLGTTIRFVVVLPTVTCPELSM